MFGGFITFVLAVGFAIGVRREPRRFGLGILLAVLVSDLLLRGFSALINLTDQGVGTMFAGLLLMAVVVVMLLLVATLGVFLIWNTVVMFRKEGRGLPARITGTVGALIVAYLAAGVVTLVFGLYDVVPWLIFTGLPATYLAFLFVAFLLYSTLYTAIADRFGDPVDAVVVLGAGLLGGERVSPLLAKRIDKGREVFEKSKAAGRDPLLIVSGGQGADEKISEAEAMSRYLVEREFDTGQLALEAKSTDTDENLRYSSVVLAERRPEGVTRIAAATSDYHAFRAAIIMRKAGLPGYAVGAKTARYYWPSAMIREFAAILMEHSRLNLVILLGLCAPLIIYAL
ncbi:YdcF family protein [Tessaracoccus caeni]|uniref:YdcF family protein n=1 Tax=Tessaracoccus caeni TaxID=3031239 RepID=UPI0023DC2B20|nr:YdcF family protein [Tessaracoccus caeni]MDF1489993.1 YdcF family protein [Tessaracoccus caeni]